MAEVDTKKWPSSWDGIGKYTKYDNLENCVHVTGQAASPGHAVV